MVKRVSPESVRTLSCTIVDVREYPEFASGAIEGAQLAPLSTVEQYARTLDKSASLLLVCKSGRRATQAAEKLVSLGFEDVAVMEGGMEAWRAAGLPVRVAERRPWSLERQVRAIAGSMVLISTVLGLTVSPWFFAWTLFVGAGLTFAGVTDICLMATLLGKLPWNRASQGCASA
ncbi:MAG: rhodanese-like domain-containing protein [Bryobacteraceae bacterium]